MEVTVTHLEMNSLAELRPAKQPGDHVDVVRVKPAMPELNRFFYTSVGGDWHWTDRLPWSYDDWLKAIGQPNQQTWMLTVAGVPAGYAELVLDSAGSVEIAYFGLLPRYIGRGLGSFFLFEIVKRAWAMPAKRVWLHTCTLDHERALANYQARGFKIFKKEVKDREVAPKPPGPWPGARG